jgi:hypothetical protein
VAAIAECEALVRSISRPLNLAEAVALARVLGDDNCFGLAWSLVHLIETAPGWGLEHIPEGGGPWPSALRQRILSAHPARHGA